MITKEHIGAVIKIIRNNAGFLNTGHHYKIIGINELDGRVNLEGIAVGWSPGKEGVHFIFISKPAKKDLQIGDRIELRDSTLSLKHGDHRVILGFVDEDHTKIIVEGVIPGGWVDSKKVKKLIDIDKYRVKTFFELAMEGGLQNAYRILGSPSNADILGEPLSKFGAKQGKYGDVKLTAPNGRRVGLTEHCIVPISKENEDSTYDIVIISERLIQRSVTVDIAIYELEGRSIFDVSLYDRSNSSLFSLSQAIYETGQIAISKSYTIDPHGLRITKVNPVLSIPFPDSSPF